MGLKIILNIVLVPKMTLEENSSMGYAFSNTKTNRGTPKFLGIAKMARKVLFFVELSTILDVILGPVGYGHYFLPNLIVYWPSQQTIAKFSDLKYNSVM